MSRLLVGQPSFFVEQLGRARDVQRSGIAERLHIEQDLAQNHPGESLFLMLAPNARRFPQPLLLDREQRQCVWLAPAALYDNTERGLGLSATAQGASALLVEGHGLAILKNPVSSLFRLADLGVETVARFVRFPFPKPTTHYPALSHCQGMDLAEWRGFEFREGAGCMECGGTGYRGRTAIHELLDLTDPIRELILDKKPTSEVRKLARKEVTQLHSVPCFPSFAHSLLQP